MKEEKSEAERIAELELAKRGGTIVLIFVGIIILMIIAKILF